MKARPILFSAPMVRALLDGTKTQTRRAIKPIKGEELDPTGIYNLHPGDIELERCPYGKPGDVLWVRETFVIECTREYHEMVADAPPQDRPYCAVENWDGEGSNYWRIPHYAASDGEPMICDDGERTRWKPSIHMPRWASRLTLVITDVRVERLQNISEHDARAEGITDGGCTCCGNQEPCGCLNPSPNARDAFAWLWHQINGAESWVANPWVWVIEFKVHKSNVDQLLREIHNKAVRAPRLVK